MVLAAAIGCTGLVSGISWARQGAGTAVQGDASSITLNAVDYQQTDVRTALRDLFQRVGVSFSIAPEVQGTVTLSLRNIRFDAALKNVLKQVDATYRIEGGVYSIEPRAENQGYGVASPTISLQLDGVAIEEFLSLIGTQPGFGYRMEGGVYHVFHQGVSTGVAAPSGLSGQGHFISETGTARALMPAQGTIGARAVAADSTNILMPAKSVATGVRAMPAAGPATVSQDEKFLYILRGNELVKVQKSDLKVMKRTKI